MSQYTEIKNLFKIVKVRKIILSKFNINYLRMMKVSGYELVKKA